ncbi:MAG: DEAD/DEAH box helicase [Parcubacteria group bacterium GW2011_GWC1_41_7]|nr:MAG: DEAD/DEAH box helicase [Parcubacteria group bacterium GW2011_GWC1_41_7]
MFMDKQQEYAHFDALGVSDALQAVLAKEGITIPTPIQQQAIPPILSGSDVMGIAQTGTGKTLAFGLPLLQRILETEKKGLIVVPTRELAVQVQAALQSFTFATDIRTAVLIGGQNIEIQIRALRKNPYIIVATPGRLIDHMKKKTVVLDKVGMLVLDEADRMLDMGFAPQIKIVLHALSEDVSQECYLVQRDAKLTLLDHVLRNNEGSVLVFAQTKYGVKKINAALQWMGYKSAEIHSNRSLSQRREALEGFKKGTYRILVATDVAARGIDVSDISFVINFDIPENPQDYVHRIGRTGRAGKQGRAISFVAPTEKNIVRTIEFLIKKPIEVKDYGHFKNDPTLPVIPATIHLQRGGPRRPRPTGAFSGSRRPTTGYRPGYKGSSTPRKPASTSKPHSHAPFSARSFRSRGPRMPRRP